MANAGDVVDVEVIIEVVAVEAEPVENMPLEAMEVVEDTLGAALSDEM